MNTSQTCTHAYVYIATHPHARHTHTHRFVIENEVQQLPLDGTIISMVPTAMVIHSHTQICNRE